MPSLIYDYTRIVSAVGQSPGRPYLVLSDLAKVIEGIVLADSVFITEDPPYGHDKPSRSEGFLSKAYIYEPVFAEIFKKVPREADEQIGLQHQNLLRRISTDSVSW